MSAKRVDKVAVNQMITDLLVAELAKINSDELFIQFKTLELSVKAIQSGAKGRFPRISNKPFYYSTDGRFYFVDPSRYLLPNAGATPTKVDGVSTSCLERAQFDVFTKYIKTCPLYSGVSEDGKITIKNQDGKLYTFLSIVSDSLYYNYYTYNNGQSVNAVYLYKTELDVAGDTLRCPVSSLFGFINALSFDLMPDDLSNDEKRLFALASEYYNNGWFTSDSDSITGYSTDYDVALRNDEVSDLGDLCFTSASAIAYIKSGKPVQLTGDAFKCYVEHLKNTDKDRIDLLPYDENRIIDPNFGHWDLWEDAAEGSKTIVELDMPLYGRNPVEDVQLDGIVGIDFGTKSTVVTVQNGTDIISPMRVGCGDYIKDIIENDYENPTVIEFINLQHFMECYKATPCRPATEWNDLTISHTAADTLNAPGNNGSEYYAWFSELKQWASDKTRKLTLKDKYGFEAELPPYAALSADQLDPIEIYAYILGLFINNMYNKIFVNYVLSFPVTFERKIRLKIADSFRKGIIKSLPKAVQNDDYVMQNVFRVLEGASEPAAYAVCALTQYGFQPMDDEKILYGIFDFGGGTTDFDFGIWSKAPVKLKRRYDNVISHFGAGGDRTLGGENILNLLAYSVLKKNEKKLRELGIQFAKPVDADKFCGVFPGSEALISNSQQARINLKQLSEKFRPLWEGETFTENCVQVNLYDTSGNAQTPTLDFDIVGLLTLIRTRIDCGVQNFFEAMKNAFTKERVDGVDRIQVFLAGNSSKSAILKESFDEYLNKYNGVFANLLGVKLQEIKQEVKSCNYFVEKYKDIWTDLVNEHRYLPDSIPENDLFMSDYDGETLFNLFYTLSDDSYDDAFELWNEGILTVKKIEMILKLDDFLDNPDGLADFIYNHPEVSQQAKSEMEDRLSIINDEKISADIFMALKKRKEYEIEAEKIAEESNVFKLYYPLGTVQAKELQKKRGIVIEDSIIAPTGKTGVAYGLLLSRPGSRIKVESDIPDTDEINFKYYTGYSTGGKFVTVTAPDIEYNKWIEFIDASEEDFEIYYTDLPEAASNEMSSKHIMKKICRIEEPSDAAMVYIRAIEPTVLEYCSAFGEDELAARNYCCIPKKIVLE